MARGMARSLPSRVQLEDMVAAGNMGVATALVRFSGDPDTFEAFAMKHARGAMLDELRQLDTMSRLGRRQARLASATATRLACQLGRMPDDAEIAAELHMDLDAYRMVVLMRSTTVVEGGFERLEAGDVPADQQIDARRTERMLSSEIQRLPERHAIVLSLSYEHDETLQSIARTLGVSVVRAHQIRVTALDRLRRCGFVKALETERPPARGSSRVPPAPSARASSRPPGAPSADAMLAFLHEGDVAIEHVERGDQMG
jgi:RNA polymerase sigma factor for flagellar operon FliA